METAGHIEHLEQDSARIEDLLGRIDFDAPISTCPGWNVRDLVHHLGGTQRWATAIVAEARSHRHWMDLDQFVLPSDDDLVQWYAAGAGSLMAALDDAPFDLNCWVFMADVASPLHFWARRQAHETGMHRVDLEAAADQLSGFSSDVASDGLDELVCGFWARENRGPRANVAMSVGFVPHDDPGRWTSFFDASSCRASRSVDPDAVQATVSGAAADLFAWAWNRPSVGPVAINGDTGAIERMKAPSA